MDAEKKLMCFENLYLDLLKKSILGTVYLDNELRIMYLRACLNGRDSFEPGILNDIRGRRSADYDKLVHAREIGRFVDGEIQNCGFPHSMMGRARLDNLHASMDLVRTDGIRGDVAECGVWRGGGCIFMAAYLHAYGMRDRRVFAADSFEGLPRPSLPQDAGMDLSKESYPELAVPVDVVRKNFELYGLDLSEIVFLKGWFKDSLITAPISELALLRLDGDLYESTIDILSPLYDRVVDGGIVIVDDYDCIPACRQAVKDFFDARREPLPKIHSIDWTGVWFRKSV